MVNVYVFAVQFKEGWLRDGRVDSESVAMYAAAMEAEKSGLYACRVRGHHEVMLADAETLVDAARAVAERAQAFVASDVCSVEVLYNGAKNLLITLRRVITYSVVECEFSN